MESIVKLTGKYSATTTIFIITTGEKNMYENAHILICEDFSKGLFNKINLTGINMANQIFVDGYPYRLCCWLVLMTARKEIAFSDSDDRCMWRLAYSPIADELNAVWHQDTGALPSKENRSGRNYLVRCPIQFDLQGDGTLLVAFEMGDFVIQRSWEIRLGDAPRVAIPSVDIMPARGVIGSKTPISVTHFVQRADRELILIDGYLPTKRLSDILGATLPAIKVLLLTGTKYKIDYQGNWMSVSKKFPNLEVRFSDYFHDRFAIINRHEIYAFGYSFANLSSGRLSYYSKIIDVEDQRLILEEFQTIWSAAHPV